jgi:hypothetical protein
VLPNLHDANAKLSRSNVSEIVSARILALGPERPALGCVSIQQGAVDTVLLKDKLEFLEQKGFNLAGSPSKHLLPRHVER